MQSIYRTHGEERVMVPVIGGNSEVFIDGTLVSVDSGGLLITATAGLRIYGVCRESVTMASTNATVAKKTPRVVEATNIEMSMLGDQAVVTGDKYKWADISTVSAGTQLVAVSTATTSGQLRVHALQTDFDTSPGVAAFQCLVHVAEYADLAYAQA